MSSASSEDIADIHEADILRPRSLQEEKKRADHRKAHLDDVLTATERNKAAAAGVAR